MMRDYGETRFHYGPARATLRAGQPCMQLNWPDEPGVWKDVEGLNPRLNPPEQLRRLHVLGHASWVKGCPRPNLRIGVCRRDGGWNGVPTPQFDPEGVLSDPERVRAFPGVYGLKPIIDGEVVRRG